MPSTDPNKGNAAGNGVSVTSMDMPIDPAPDEKVCQPLKLPVWKSALVRPAKIMLSSKIDEPVEPSSVNLRVASREPINAAGTAKLWVANELLSVVGASTTPNSTPFNVTVSLPLVVAKR